MENTENVSNEFLENTEINQASATTTPKKSKTQTESPRSILKKSTPTKAIRAKNVYLVKNENTKNAKPKLYRLSTFDNLLKDSVDLLVLPTPAKAIFTVDGKQIKAIDEIKEKQTLLVSCGEDFQPGYVPPKPPQLQKPEAPPPMPSFTEQKSSQSPKFSQTKSKTATLKSKSKKELEGGAFQRSIAAAHFTADECLRDSTACIYWTMSEEFRKKLPNHRYLQALFDDTQHAQFILHMFEKSICPNSVNIFVDDPINRQAMNILNGLTIEDIKFVIEGPRKSGKTSFLFTLAKQLARKLQVSDQPSKYMFFPMNFELLVNDFNNARNLLKSFITTILDSLKYSNYKLLPYIPLLRQFFNTVIHGNIPQFPSALEKVDFIDAKTICKLGKELSRLLHQTTPEALVEFVQALVRVPQEMAIALGFTAPIYIFDTFEFCDVEIRPGPDFFPQAIQTINFAPLLSAQLNGGYYIVTMQDDQRFLECFACNDSALIELEGIVKDTSELADIFVYHPKIHITIDDCNGYPGYITQYIRVAEAIRDYKNNMSKRSAYSTIRLTADLSRDFAIKQELKKLIRYLLNIPDTKLSQQMLADIDNEKLVIRDPPQMKVVTEEEEDQLEPLLVVPDFENVQNEAEEEDKTE